MYARGPALRAFTESERAPLNLNSRGAEAARRLFRAKKPLHFYEPQIAPDAGKEFA